jgi:3-phenylpropionate/trans-cinnamate dioxygenase ferredoxin reductase subunit
MSRVVCPVVSAFYHRRHTEAGVALHYGAAVSGFAGETAVEAVETLGGERYSCDCVIVGVGVVPNVELAKAAGLSCDDGIEVDEYGRTEDPCIAAAGDCTRHPYPLAGKRVRLESVQNAIEQAKAAASNFAGMPRAYTEVPWFWSDQYDLKLQIAGLAHGHDELAMRGDPDSGAFAVYYLRAGVVIAIDAVNSPRDFMLARKMIAAGCAVKSEVLADLAVNLTELVARWS